MLLLRKQILITEAHEDYLRSLSEATGESQCHIMRQAIDLHARQLNPSSIPGLLDDEKKPPTTTKTNESEF
jgi:hypothetical protein